MNGTQLNSYGHMQGIRRNMVFAKILSNQLVMTEYTIQA